jgi:hypothetical protein
MAGYRLSPLDRVQIIMLIIIHDCADLFFCLHNAQEGSCSTADFHIGIQGVSKLLMMRFEGRFQQIHGTIIKDKNSITRMQRGCNNL